MVEYTSIGSLIKRRRIKAKSINNDAPVYAVTNDRGFVLSETMHEFKIHSEDTSNYLVVNEDDFAYNPSRLNIGSISYFQFQGKGLISPMYVVFEIDKTRVLPEYLYIVIKSEYVRNKIDSLKEVGARFRFDFSRWDLIKIPVPSLEVQKSIIKKLHVFGKSVANLEKQIDNRLKQFKYYRNLLLGCSDSEAVEVKTLGDLSNRIFSGKNKDKSNNGLYPVFGSTGIIAYTDNYVYNKKLILVARVGANAGFVHIAEGKYDVTDNTLIVDLKDGINQEYIYYCMINADINQFAKGGGQPLITGAVLKQLIFNIPSLEKQRKVVTYLQKFESIIDNLQKQLICRQKQYEYYRNKLLTFE